MRVLSSQELVQMEGGSISLWVSCGIIALVVLAAGIIDGFTRPLKCND